ncbi:MAG: diaminopimelate epimerase [Candidatus Methanofastidiosia archaeon]|jgi:diaminopimelate epimerase
MVQYTDIEFYKMSGTGNDFIVIDNREFIIRTCISDFVKAVCTRRVSVGADGVILVEPSDKYTIKMRYFNADGSEGEMCGNGARCICRYAFLKGMAGSKMEIETKSGPIKAEVMDRQVKIRLNPFTKKEFNKKIHTKTGEISVDYLEQGNPGLPHAVVYKEHLTFNEDIEKIGREIRTHPLFPKGTNVNFFTIDKGIIFNRTYERGVEAETLCCGTGAASVAAVCYLKGMSGPQITVKTKGGILHIAMSTDHSAVYCTGDVIMCYRGVLPSECISIEKKMKYQKAGEVKK